MKTDFQNIQNPCVLFSNGLGDHFIALPTMRALAHLFKDRLTLVTQELSHTEVIFQEVAFKHILRTKHFNNQKFDAQELIKALEPYDALISITPWVNTSLMNLLKLFRPRKTFGLFENFEYRAAFKKPIHQSDMAFCVPQIFDATLQVEDFAYAPTLPDQVKRVPAVFREKIPADCKLLVVHTDTKPEKMWSADKFIQVINELLDSYSQLGVVMVGIDMPDLAQCSAPERIICFDKVPFEVSWGVVSCADYFLGVDSVFLHTADLHQVPSVGIFQDDNYKEFGLRFAKHRHVISSTGRMEDIQVNEVLDALQQVFAQEDQPAMASS
ncbi:MAG TPA: hypothetical protein DCS93_13480 [Microscillaceae bacterium]|nr:hypothetical protein [Microscillaceae bacterium]